MALGHDYSAIGERGKARRRQLGLSVHDLGARMGVVYHRVYSLECYGAGSIHLVEQWARALDMDPRELAFGPVKHAAPA